MTVPVVLGVHFLFHVPILIIASHQDIAVVAIVRHHLIKISVRTLEYGQLGVTTTQCRDRQKRRKQHGHALTEAADGSAVDIGGLHVRILSVVEPETHPATGQGFTVQTSSLCVNAKAGIRLPKKQHRLQQGSDACS